MKLKLNRGHILARLQPSEQGFSLIETVIALTTLGVCLAYAMPLFLYAKINNSKSEIRTGALIVSQRVFDNIRSKSFKDIPNTDGFIQNIPDLLNTSNPEKLKAEKILTNAMGRPYKVTVTYCEGLTSDPTICTEKYRKFKVEVSFNDSKVYDLEGNYTDFQ